MRGREELVGGGRGREWWHRESRGGEGVEGERGEERERRGAKRRRKGVRRGCEEGEEDEEEEKKSHRHLGIILTHTSYTLQCALIILSPHERQWQEKDEVIPPPHLSC